MEEHSEHSEHSERGVYRLAKYTLVVAHDDKYGIGKDGTIPWDCPRDRKFFIDETAGSTVIMGRKTYFSIPEKHRPLKGRTNIVISRQYKDIEGVVVVNSFKKALMEAYARRGNLSSITNSVDTYVIGGEQIYRIALGRYSYLCKGEYITHIKGDYECDTFYPNDLLPGNLTSMRIDTPTVPDEELTNLSGKTYVDECYIELSFTNISHGELPYRRLLRRVLSQPEREDRTGTGTRSLFGAQMEFDISETIPIFTSKRVAWKAVLKELLFFISGETDTKILEAQGVNIWKGNTSKEFLEKRGLRYEEGVMGPGYGYQWRHWGASHRRGKLYGNGIDQLNNLIHDIRENPLSRRHMLTSWNVEQIDDMAIPPCHFACQFYVTSDAARLDCQLYQRSGDMFLGVPFNIASYSMLTYIVAHLTGYKPGRLIVTLGDAHIYTNHVEQVREQLSRTPLPLPILMLKPFESLDELTFEHFSLKKYFPWPTIKAEMAV